MSGSDYFYVTLAKGLAKVTDKSYDVKYLKNLNQDELKELCIHVYDEGEYIPYYNGNERYELNTNITGFLNGKNSQINRDLYPRVGDQIFEGEEYLLTDKPNTTTFFEFLEKSLSNKILLCVDEISLQQDANPFASFNQN